MNFDSFSSINFYHILQRILYFSTEMNDRTISITEGLI
jgi:hypothetical protein